MLHKKRQDLTAEARHKPSGNFVEFSAGVTHYEFRGDTSGECVVLVHGNAAPYVTWNNTIDDLCAAGFRVLRYDLFGHGFSDRPKLPRYDKRFYDTQLTELLGRLDIPHPILVVGTSQGGSIGACFASEHPGRVKKLALLSPLFDSFEGSQSVVMSLMKIPFVGEFLLQLARDAKFIDLSGAILSVDTRTSLERDVAEQFRFAGKRRAILANLRGGALEDAASCYQNVSEQGVPTMLTWGSLGRKISGDSMRRLRDLLSQIEYHEIEGAGHLAHYEFPDRINPHLIRFLTE